MTVSRKRGQQQIKRKPEPVKGPIKEGIKKGEPIPVPPGAFPPLPGPNNCKNCTITTINGQQVGPGRNGVAFISEDTKEFTLTATRNPANCPCNWSNVNIEYVAVATGSAKNLKRKNFKFDQLLQVITINGNDPRNPYITINNCVLTIKISQLNKDLRDGINTQRVFFKGVVTLVKLGVKCNGRIVTLYLNITDK
jgi:hypothetical protein